MQCHIHKLVLAISELQLAYLQIPVYRVPWRQFVISTWLWMWMWLLYQAAKSTIDSFLLCIRVNGFRKLRALFETIACRTYGSLLQWNQKAWNTASSSKPIKCLHCILYVHTCGWFVNYCKSSSRTEYLLVPATRLRTLQMLFLLHGGLEFYAQEWICHAYSYGFVRFAGYFKSDTSRYSTCIVHAPGGPTNSVPLHEKFYGNWSLVWENLWHTWFTTYVL